MAAIGRRHVPAGRRRVAVARGPVEISRWVDSARGWNMDQTVNVARDRRLRPASARAVEAVERRVLFAGAAFQLPSDYPVTGSADFVALAQLNGDANLDMIVSSYAGSLLSVRLGSSNGTFGAPT